MGRPESIGFELKALNNQIRRLMDSKAGKSRMSPITGMQHGVIHYICDHSKEGDVFQKDLEQEFNIRRSTATGILQLMERNGLLRREPVAHDARLKKLVLTPKALEIHAHILADIVEMDRIMTQGVSEEDLATFRRVVRTISKNLDSHS